MKPLAALLAKDLRTEWRHKQGLFAVLLYVGSTVFALYIMAGRPEAQIWNALFWISQLFAAVNAAARSFLSESPARFRYYATLVPSRTFFLSRLIYGLLLQGVVTLLSMGLFSLLLGLPLYRPALFIVLSLAGSLSLALVFTFLSAIAARAGGNAALMAILGFPLLVPVLMLLGNLAAPALTPVLAPGWWTGIAALLGLDVLMGILGIILFPLLWTE